ncbi:hypothetical protein GMES_1339 [Paraglaciecola mesophila KMM 241]|uniref:Uncharacterized protein n=1 Tax=Paraglaciecola mesophila KMM 241 TaxID=1128912 RepID=K6Z3Q7_9ALTE|nr:hypothetical protein GMES_1339 [Paraglaciecola mesophila KMM 241]
MSSCNRVIFADIIGVLLAYAGQGLYSMLPVCFHLILVILPILS